jgi:hypothetical protein
MITLLANTFPIALSLAAPSLPEVPSVVLAIALVLLITLAMAMVLAMAGTVNTAVEYLAEAPANRLAMPHFLHKKSRRHAASPSVTLDLNQSRPTSPCLRWSSSKGTCFTFAAPVFPLNNHSTTGRRDCVSSGTEMFE